MLIVFFAGLIQVLPFAPRLFVKCPSPYKLYLILRIGFNNLVLLVGLIIVFNMSGDVKRGLVRLGGGRDLLARRGRQAVRNQREWVRADIDGMEGREGREGRLGRARMERVEIDRLERERVARAAGVGGVAVNVGADNDVNQVGAGGEAAAVGVEGVAAIPTTNELADRMRLVYQLLLSFLQGLLEGRWDAAQLTVLDDLWLQLVWPVFQDMVLQNAVCFIGKRVRKTFYSIFLSLKFIILNLFMLAP